MINRVLYLPTQTQYLIEALDRRVIVDNEQHDAMVKDRFLYPIDQLFQQHVFHNSLSVYYIL